MSDDPELPEVPDWGIRRADGSVIRSSRAWAEDVHALVGLTVVRGDAGVWADA